MASAALGDLLQTRWHVGVRDVRRYVTSAGLIANSALMLALAAATGVRGAAGAALSIALFSAAFAVLGISIGGGYQVNHLDIASGATTGIVAGISNTYGSAAGVVAPWVMGALTAYPEGMPRERWVDAPPPGGWIAEMASKWAGAFVFAVGGGEGGAVTSPDCRRLSSSGIPYII